MKATWERLSSWIDSRNLRERALLFAASLAVLLMASYAWLFEPLRSEERALLKQMQAGTTAVTTIQAEITKMAEAAPVDPNAQDKLRLDKLIEEMKRSDASLMESRKGLVHPDQVGALLENVLARQGKLQLVSLKKLPPQSLAASSVPPVPAGAAAQVSPQSEASAESAPSGLIYKHGVEIVVRGKYLDIVDYLTALDELPQKVAWGDIRFQVIAHPEGKLTLQLFTLSMEKAWLNL